MMTMMMVMMAMMMTSCWLHRFMKWQQTDWLGSQCLTNWQLTHLRLKARKHSDGVWVLVELTVERRHPKRHVQVVGSLERAVENVKRKPDCCGGGGVNSNENKDCVGFGTSTQEMMSASSS
jgi:hypothetical protein